MSKALQVFTCVFTHTPPDNGVWNIDALPSSEGSMYNAVVNANGAIVAQEGGNAPLIVSMCYAPDPQFKDFIDQVKMSPPFMATMGTFADGSKKYFATKNTSQIGLYIRAMYLGEFGGTGLPTNAGEGDGGWGQGDSILCNIIPPLCALGFLPWLVLSAVTTYKAVESRSTVGKTMWGVPAFLLWQGFLARGGVKQIQWWVKKLGNG